MDGASQQSRAMQQRVPAIRHGPPVPQRLSQRSWSRANQPAPPQELARLAAAGLAGEAARRARGRLLARELRAAQALDRLRRCAAAEARAGALEARLAAAGAPHRWPLSNARWAAVDTPATSRRGSEPAVLTWACSNAAMTSRHAAGRQQADAPLLPGAAWPVGPF